MTKSEIKKVNRVLGLFGDNVFTVDNGPIIAGCDITLVEEDTKYDEEVAVINWEQCDHFFNRTVTAEDILNGDWNDESFILNDSLGEPLEIKFFELKPIVLK